MNQRSFRLTPVSRSSKRVVPRLRFVYACVLFIDLALGMAVLGLAAIVGTQTNFFRDDTPNWIVIIAFATLTVFAFQSVRTSTFLAAKAVAAKYLVAGWMTTEQVKRFPGWRDAWPECWLESRTNGQESD